jgi:hypothetical protein
LFQRRQALRLVSHARMLASRARHLGHLLVS